LQSSKQRRARALVVVAVDEVIEARLLRSEGVARKARRAPC
jgi:hypothetical protein